MAQRARRHRRARGFGNKYRRRVETARLKAEDLLGRIQEAADKGDWRLYRHLVFKYLRDDNAKLAALDDRNRKAPQRYRLNNKDLKNRVPEVDVVGPGGVANVKLVPKANGGKRAVVRFALVDQARQELVKRALEPWITRHIILDFQHAVANGGHQAACRAVFEEIRDRPELKFVVLADISDQYNSFDEAGVLDILPAQAGTVRGTILADAYRYSVSRRSSLSLSCVQARKLRQGIPQGSVASPLVAEVLMAAILKGVDLRDHFIRVSADNIVVAARNRAEANWTEDVLVAAFRRSPAGCLRLKTCVRRVADGFDFLGYGYRRQKGVVSVKPSRANRAKFIREFWFRQVERRSRGRKLPVRKLARRIRSWCAAFPLWDEDRWGPTFVRMLWAIKDYPPRHVRFFARLLDGRDGFHRV